MTRDELSDAIMELKPEERLELARRLIESVFQPDELSDSVKQGIRRIEDVATERVVGIPEDSSVPR